MNLSEERSCWGKSVYRHRADAAAAVRRARRRTRGDAIAYYRCEFCGALHIGHTPAALREWRTPWAARPRFAPSV